MDWLRNNRVVIIDDRPDEIQPLLDALGLAGVAVIYRNGQFGEAKPKMLENVRLVFLDLELISNPNSHAQLRTTVEILRTNVNLAAPGLGLVYWTKHEEHGAAFEKLLSEQVPEFKPIVKMAASKVEILADTANGLARLSKELADQATKFPGFRSLNAVGSVLHDAAHETVADLLRLGKSDDEHLTIQASMINAVAGPEGPLPPDVLGCVVECAAQTIHDRAKAIAASMKPDRLPAAELRSRVELIQQRKLVPSPLQSASINAALHVTAIFPIGGTQWWPGSVVLGDSCDAIQGIGFVSATQPVPQPPSSERIAGVMTDTAKGAVGVSVAAPPNSEVEIKFGLATRMFNTICKKCPVDATALAAMKAEGAKFREAFRDLRLIALEITPPCDFAQNKPRIPRFLLGITCRIADDSGKDLPAGALLEVNADSRMFAKRLPDFYLDKPLVPVAGIWRLVVNARYLVHAEQELLAKSRPSFRIRDALATDVQAWFAGHAVRPGIVSL
jgi:hypothetical protein